jgi:hypothetical protein
MSTHVTAALMARLPVPRPPGVSRAFAVLVDGARVLARHRDIGAAPAA